jgi:hypothetical protein
VVSRLVLPRAVRRVMSNRTPGTEDLCAYCPPGKRCREEGAGELRSHYYKTHNNGIPWTMCAEHMKPEHHPPDLHDKLAKW